MFNSIHRDNISYTQWFLYEMSSLVQCILWGFMSVEFDIRTSKSVIFTQRTFWVTTCFCLSCLMLFTNYSQRDSSVFASWYLYNKKSTCLDYRRRNDVEIR